MRVALVAVASAIAGASAVLLAVPPVLPPGPTAEAAADPVWEASGAEGSLCPPCDAGPLGPIGWIQVVGAPGGDESLERAAAVSLAIREPEQVERALFADEPALRELAALLLNVGSGRVAACTPLGKGRKVAAVLDKLDRLVARILEQQPVEAEELAAAVDAAAVLNRGEGLPPGCGG